MSRAVRNEGGHSQRRIKVLEERFRILLESAPDGMVIVGSDGRIAFVNAKVESLFGFSRDEVVGQPVEILVPLERRAALRERFARPFESFEPGPALAGLDLLALRRDGTEFPVEIHLSHARTADGGVVTAAIRDVTERGHAEERLRRTQEQLRQVQKMEAVGKLAGGIAHDFNDVLSVILSYAGFLTDAVKTDDELRSDVDEIRKAADRAVHLTRQLLAFSKEQSFTPRAVSLNEIVVGLEKMLGRMAGDAVDLTFVSDPLLGMVRADPGQLEQVVMNLVVNARDAMPGGGHIVIETTRVDLAAGQAPPRPEMEAGEYAVLAVTDTGIGMDQATRERVFEPFFTTKEKGKGTGLGLSVVYGIVAQSGGHVVVDSEPGKGTTFRVFLPRTAETADASMSAPPSQAAGGSESVLLVEDDDQVRVVVATILRRNGYTVVEARNAGEAFFACGQHTVPIDLLLTDVVMPRMNGHELAARLLASHAGMKVLFMSGHPESERLDADVPVFDHLEKPVTADALLRRVRAVLDRSPPRVKAT